jgi:rhodanese-related sulfurtransferase
MIHSERFLAIVDDALTRVSEITPEETASKIERGDAMLLIDTREDSEWERGRIKGAIHIGKGVIERDIEKMAPELDREIILYCGGGYRSALAADTLQKMGYTNVKSMAEGWRGWNDRGLPTES